jgi:hypothetical protein
LTAMRKGLRPAWIQRAISTAGGGQNPVADFDDQAGFLGDRNEAGRRDRAVGRVMPADQASTPVGVHPGR